MKKITTVLFDFDGVIADTEPQYDIYVDDLAKRYNLGIEDFATKVKGTTTPDILKKYFNHLSEEEVQKIDNEISDFELEMDYPLIEGVMEFIQHLKDNGYKIGLVTSSQDFKMKVALDKLNLNHIFDTKVTANRITQGKPNPMCYKLAAEDLGAHPSECVVFEDSFHGIQAGKDAGMKVVGVSSTIPADRLEEKAHAVIPHFGDIEKVVNLLN